jgi:hypothetical protein
MLTLPYFLVTAAIAFAAVVFPRQRVNPFGWAAAFVLLVVYIGLRHKVGMDWNNYLVITDRIQGGGPIEAMEYAEPGFALLTWLSTRIGAGIYGVNLASAVVFCAGLFRLCRRTESPWLALAMATPFLVTVVAMSASRQAIAIGILFWLVAEWKAYPLHWRIGLILLATSFHYSACFFLCFSALDLDARPAVKIAVALVLAFAALWVLESTGSAEYYVTSYVSEKSELTYSPGAIQHVLLNAAPALLLLCGRRIRERLFPSLIVKRFALLALLLVPTAFFFSTAAGRVSFYLFPVSLFALSALPSIFSAASVRAIVRLVLVCASGFLLWFWLTYANSAQAYVPYENALWMERGQLHL